MKGTWFQTVESTSPFKFMVSDVILHPYAEALSKELGVLKTGVVGGGGSKLTLA